MSYLQLSSLLNLVKYLQRLYCNKKIFFCRELTSTFARLCHQADMTRQQLEESLKDMDKNLQQLQQVASASKTLR